MSNYKVPDKIKVTMHLSNLGNVKKKTFFNITFSITLCFVTVFYTRIDKYQTNKYNIFYTLTYLLKVFLNPFRGLNIRSRKLNIGAFTPTETFIHRTRFFIRN